MKCLLFLLCTMPLLVSCRGDAEKPLDGQLAFTSNTADASVNTQASAARSSQPVSPADPSASVGTTSTGRKWPEQDYWPEPLPVTKENLVPFADLITPFPYEKPGNQLTDQEFISSVTALLPSGKRVMEWYRGNPVDLQSDRYLFRFTQENGSSWRPIARSATLEELEMLRNAVFSHRYYKNSLILYDGFASFGRRLYQGDHTSNGVVNGVVMVWHVTKPVVLAKTAEVLVLDMGKVTEDDGESYAQPPYVVVRQGDYWVLDNWV